VVFDCSDALSLDPSYAKALTRRAAAHEKLEQVCVVIVEL
jgi:hypothetical protein